MTCVEKNWELSRPQNWSPVILSTRTFSFTIENAVKVFQANEEDGLEFLQENLGTNREEIEKFAEAMFIRAIWRAEPTFLTSCGRYIRSLLEIRLLTATGLQPILGRLVQSVVLMKDKPHAWAHLGEILHELYNPWFNIQHQWSPSSQHWTPRKCIWIIQSLSKINLKHPEKISYLNFLNSLSISRFGCGKTSDPNRTKL